MQLKRSEMSAATASCSKSSTSLPRPPRKITFSTDVPDRMPALLCP